jgi:hypothetical protein
MLFGSVMPTEESSSLVSNIWNQRKLGIDLHQDLGAVTTENITYICEKNYPFIQIINPDAIFSEENKTNFLGAGIHDYGDAISAAFPHNKTTKQSQGLWQINTTAEIAKLIVAKEWGAVEIIAGTETMTRMLWVELKRYGLDFKEFEPDDKAQKCYERLMKHAKDNGLLWEKTAPEKPADELAASGAS